MIRRRSEWLIMVFERSLTTVKASGLNRRPDCLAVVLGWYGCSPRQLRRHASAFTDVLHTDTVVYAPCMAAASFPLVGRYAARSLAKEISKHDQMHGAKSILFLVLSGHGENLLDHFLLEQVCCDAYSQTIRLFLLCFVHVTGRHD